jgi:hypothetical protein
VAVQQDARYVITNRLANGAPVWAAENGEWQGSVTAPLLRSSSPVLVVNES